MQLHYLNFDQLSAPESLNIRVDYGEIQELADSIRESGLQMPLTVTPDIDNPDKFRVLDGFRRMRALSILNQSGIVPEQIPVLIRELNKTDSLYLQFNGNSGKGLLPLEFGLLCAKLELQGESLETIAQKTGKSKAYIDDCINLTYSPEPILEAIRNGQLSGTAVIKASKKTTSEDLEALIKEAEQIIQPDNNKPVKIKLPTNSGNPLKSDKAVNVLMELYQETGNEKILLLVECITGNISVNALVHEFKSL
jgi:ParB/RepB/Spo0J family partition protein